MDESVALQRFPRASAPPEDPPRPHPAERGGASCACLRPTNPPTGAGHRAWRANLRGVRSEVAMRNTLSPFCASLSASEPRVEVQSKDFFTRAVGGACLTSCRGTAREASVKAFSARKGNIGTTWRQGVTKVRITSRYARTFTLYKSLGGLYSTRPCGESSEPLVEPR